MGRLLWAFGGLPVSMSWYYLKSFHQKHQHAITRGLLPLYQYLRRHENQWCVQVFHYVGHFTDNAVDVNGYLQIPTFFLLSGFCLSLGSFLTFSFDHPFCCQDMDHHQNLGECLSSTLLASAASIPFTSLQISSQFMPPILQYSYTPKCTQSQY